MIMKGMDVKELVRSDLFYPEIWKNYTCYSPIQKTILMPYNDDKDNLEYEDPNQLFVNWEVGDNVKSLSFKMKKCLTKGRKQLKNHFIKNKDELFEMQFHFIFMDEIEKGDKINVSKILKDCDDIELFEQEAV